MDRVRRVIIAGAGGRDFHDFNVCFRDDPSRDVVAFTAAQIPGIADRVYPPELAGPRYPRGIPIAPEDELSELISGESVDEVVLSYSDLSHEEVMHKCSAVLTAGAEFRVLGPRETMLESRKPVVAVCAVRTGAGKSQTSRRIAQILGQAGCRVALVRHPMPYGNLVEARVQRFASLADIDAAGPTIEEREEFELPVSRGVVVFAGVDYAAVLELAEEEADVIVWDGGNNDYPFFAPDLMVTVVDPLRPGDEIAYHPGETCLRMADVVLVNKVNAAEEEDVEIVIATARAVNPGAIILRAASTVTLEPGPEVKGARVLVVEDGPSLTHGGMPFGAGTVAAREAGAAELVDPTPHAVGSIAATLRQYHELDAVLPAMGYSDEQLAELAETIESVDCDLVIAGTPIDLGRLIQTRHPIRRALYELEERGGPSLEEVVKPIIALVNGARSTSKGTPR